MQSDRKTIFPILFNLAAVAAMPGFLPGHHGQHPDDASGRAPVAALTSAEPAPAPGLGLPAP